MHSANGDVSPEAAWKRHAVTLRAAIAARLANAHKLSPIGLLQLAEAATTALKLKQEAALYQQFIDRPPWERQE